MYFVSDKEQPGRCVGKALADGGCAGCHCSQEGPRAATAGFFTSRVPKELRCLHVRAGWLANSLSHGMQRSFPAAQLWQPRISRGAGHKSSSRCTGVRFLACKPPLGGLHAAHFDFWRPFLSCCSIPGALHYRSQLQPVGWMATETCACFVSEPCECRAASCTLTGAVEPVAL